MWSFIIVLIYQYTIYAIESMLYKFPVNPLTFAFTSAHIAHYMFDEALFSNETFAMSQQYETT